MVFAMRLSGLAALLLVHFGATQDATEGYEYLAKFWHDSQCFTQGLEFLNETHLLESCGLYGSSRLQLVEIPQVQPPASLVARNNTVYAADVITTSRLTREYFAEGITIVGDEVFMLTWHNHRLLVFDLNTLKLKRQYKYPYEGWGIAWDPVAKMFYATDGTNKVHRFRISQRAGRIHFFPDLVVECDGAPVEQLNEIELYNGILYANVWYKNEVFKIDVVNDGACLGKYSFEGMYDGKGDVFNGIAFRRPPVPDQRANVQRSEIYHDEPLQMIVTGKHWSLMFEVLIEQNYVPLPKPSSSTEELQSEDSSV